MNARIQRLSKNLLEVNCFENGFRKKTYILNFCLGTTIQNTVFSQNIFFSKQFCFEPFSRNSLIKWQYTPNNGHNNWTWTYKFHDGLRLRRAHGACPPRLRSSKRMSPAQRSSLRGQRLRRAQGGCLPVCLVTVFLSLGTAPLSLRTAP